jgi:hypothetical protein
MLAYAVLTARTTPHAPVSAGSYIRRARPQLLTALMGV